MVFFLALMISAYVLLLKAPFYLKRSLADACLEIVDENEEKPYSSNEGGVETKPKEEEEELSERLIKDMAENKRN
jgi:hypothetical protein